MWKRFTFKVVVFTGLVVLFIGAFNWVVDPYGLISNKNKFDADLSTLNSPNITNLKINLKADYYLIGTSRVMRINPNLIEKYLPTKKVYNINISGATFEENSILANKLINNKSHFMYGFDAFSLNSNRFIEEDIKNRYMSYKSQLEKTDIFFNYFSADFFFKSFKYLLKKILKNDTNVFTDAENNKKCIAVTLSGIDDHLNLSNKGLKKGSFTNFVIENDDKIIKLAKLSTQNDIFIIYPKHYYHYLLFEKYQNIENKYFHAINVLVNNTNAQVFMFYGINEITKNDDNFDENGWHFKPKIADLIFAKIFNDKNISIPADFGVKLTKENIESHLTKLRMQREIWRKTYPKDVAEIENLDNNK